MGERIGYVVRELSVPQTEFTSPVSNKEPCHPLPFTGWLERDTDKVGVWLVNPSVKALFLWPIRLTVKSIFI